MRFNPKSEEELIRLLPKGIYDARVRNAVDKTSQSGNEMIEVVVEVYADDGSKFVITDWLLEKISYKIRHFCESAGILNLYESGMICADDCVGKEIKVRIKIDTSDDDYGPQNRIADYVPDRKLKPNGNGAVKQPTKPRPQVAPVAAAAKEISGDDIPF